MKLDATSDTRQLTLRPQPAAARLDEAVPLAEHAAVTYTGDASQPVHLVITDARGSQRFEFADQAALRAFLAGEAQLPAEELEPARRALLLQLRARVQLDTDAGDPLRPPASLTGEPSKPPPTARGLPAPRSSAGFGLGRAGPGSRGASAGASADEALSRLRGQPQHRRAGDPAAQAYGAGYYASLPTRADAFRRALPELTASEAQVRATVWSADARLASILTSSRPEDLQARLVAEFGGASELEKLAVATSLAQLLVVHTYNDEAFRTDRPTNTSTPQVLAALQTAMRTGQPAPAGICGDIHVAVAQLYAALGMQSGVAKVENHVVSVFRTSGGAFGINDYGKLYLGRDPVELFGNYETARGQVLLWHDIGDEHGRIVGRVQTPAGAFIEQSLSPARSFQAFLAGEPLPVGTSVTLFDGRGEPTGRAEFIREVGPGITARLAAGRGQPLGNGIKYAVMGFGYEEPSAHHEINVGRYDIDFASGAQQRLAVYELASGWRSAASMLGGKVSYGAGGKLTGQVNVDDPKRNDSYAQVNLGARYDRPLAGDVGSTFVSVDLTGLPAGRMQDRGTRAGAAKSSARALTFANNEVEVAGGVSLKTSDQGSLGLRSSVRRTGTTTSVGAAVEGRTGQTTASVELGASRPTGPFGQSGPQLQAGVSRRLDASTVASGSLVQDRLLGRAAQVSVEKTGKLELEAELPPAVRAAIERVGVDPQSIALPREGLLRGLQYRALAGLQRGEHVSSGVLAALELQVDPVDSTFVLPGWASHHMPATVNLSGSARVGLGNLRDVDLGPAIALDGEFGAWGFQVLSTLERMQATVKLGVEQRLVLGGSVGLSGRGPGAEAIVGWETQKKDGTSSAVMVTSAPNLVLQQGSRVYGDAASTVSLGLGGVRRVSLTNPGVMDVDPSTGDVFAYKQAGTTQGYLDLFQYVTRPAEQKAHIRRIVGRLAELPAQGMSVFFSAETLAQLRTPEHLAKLSAFVDSPAFASAVARTRQAGGDSVIFDALAGDGQSYYDAGKGDLHIASLSPPASPEVRESPPEQLNAERRQLVSTWQARGLRLVGVDALREDELTGLTKLLDFMDANLDPAQYVNKQLVLNDGSPLRSIGEALGVLSLHRTSEAGATLSLAPRLLRQLARVHLGPSEVVLDGSLSEAQRQTAAAFVALLDQSDLRVNGARRLIFLPNARFEEAAQLNHAADDYGAPHRPRAFFAQRGDAVLVDAEWLVGQHLPERLDELRRTVGGKVTEALAALRAQQTHGQRSLAMARVSGDGVLHQFYPDAPPQRLAGEPPGLQYTYRVFDAYGRPAKRADGTPLAQRYQLFFPDGTPEVRVTILPDEPAPGAEPPAPLILRRPEDVQRLGQEHPELAVLLDGLAEDPTRRRLPGLRLLHRMREAAAAATS